MKAGTCLFLESFSFDKGETTLISQLSQLSQLMARMNSDFVKFYKSNEYDIKLATKLYSPSSDIGWLMQEFYNMGSIHTLSINCNELLNIINSDTPTYNLRKLCMYNNDNNPILTHSRELTILCEEELVMLCRKILDEYPRNYIDYGNSIKEIFKNILFLENDEHPNFKTFNNMDKIKGGFENFSKGITEFIYFVNNYKVTPHDASKNIKIMSTSLKYELCEEGGKKSERKQGELNRDFKVGENIYKNINCEFHYKLSFKDGQFNKGKFYNENRIYFGFFNKINELEPKIAIAHIGEHL